MINSEDRKRAGDDTDSASANVFARQSDNLQNMPYLFAVNFRGRNVPESVIVRIQSPLRYCLSTGNDLEVRFGPILLKKAETEAS